MNIIDFNFKIEPSMCAYILIYRYVLYNENADFFDNKKQQALAVYNKFLHFNFNIQNLINNEFIKELQRTSLFIKNLEESKKYLNCIEKDWGKYKSFANNYVSRTLGYTKEHKPVDVYIAKSSAFTGKNFIVFGMPQSVSVKGFNLAYLMHEWLHQIENEIFKDIRRINTSKMFCHALIELCAERNISKICHFEQKHFVSHESLISYRECLYPYFETQLLSGKTGLEDFFIWTDKNALKLKNKMLKSNNNEKDFC